MATAAVRVPASTANLGPGFDAFALALQLHNRFEAEDANEWRVQIVGEGADHFAADDTNRVAVAMARLFVDVGEAGRCAHVRCANEVPPGQGLGSSSAAIVGGLLLAASLAEADVPTDRLLDLATELEGHPDNAAAALLGGLTISWTDDGGPNAAALQPAGGLAVVAIPAVDPLATVTSRALLPSHVTHRDASFNAGRAGLLVAGLLLGEPELTRPGLGDRLHEPYRARTIVDFAEVCNALLLAGSTGTALSGAGPTVVGIVQDVDDEAAFERAQRVAEAAAISLSSLPTRLAPVALRLDRDGAQLV